MPKKKPNGKVAIEKLAKMNQREFVLIGEHFDGTDKRLDKIGEDMVILRRDSNAGFHSVGEVLKMMREDLKDIKGSVFTINEDYAELCACVGRLEKKVELSG